MNELKDRILGSLAAAIIGDAMGAVTETRAVDQIFAENGGPMTELRAPDASSPFAGGRGAGQWTDDTHQMVELAHALIATQGRVTPKDVVDALLRWADNEECFRRFAGPTTRAAILRFRAGEDPIAVGRAGNTPMQGTSNGAAMKIAPVGLINPGDPEAAVRLVVPVCQPTHGTSLAISGAGAVAAAVAAALEPSADVFSVVRAALYGAREGERLGREVGRTTAGASVERRIELAVETALRSPDLESACRNIAGVVGCGLHISESVPAAIGFVVAAGGDPMQAIYGGVNGGDDTDTVAAMAGAIAGALRGVGALPAAHVQTVEQANEIDLGALAGQLAGVALQRKRSA